MQVYYSSNYTEGEDPNTSTWVEFLGFNLSTTLDYTWETSGNIDVSQILGEDVRVAFKYTSEEVSGSRTWQIDDILLVGTDETATVQNKKSSNINKLSVFPNPTKGTIKLAYSLNLNSEISLQIYDSRGRLVFSEIDLPKEKGSHNYTLTPSLEDMPSGLYFIKVSDKEGFNTIKLLKE